VHADFTVNIGLSNSRAHVMLTRWRNIQRLSAPDIAST
jgi:hypothetical protein